MVFTFTSTETGRSVSVTVDGRDGAGGRCLHVIPSSWLVGSQKVRIHYAACIALGEFGNCQVAYLGFHSLKAPSGVTFVPVGSLN